MSDEEQPYLEVRKPDGGEYIIRFENISSPPHRITIGRNSNNHISLPDPDKTISRQHCIIQQLEATRWWLLDDRSANGTFLQDSEKIDIREEGKLPLKDGDIFLIPAKLIDNQPIYWQFTFRDPGQTNTLLSQTTPVALEYNPKQQRLFRVTSKQREEISLTPTETALIDYMARKNATYCQHQELIEAVWDNTFGCHKKSITRLVWGIRNKIEVDPRQPQFLQTVRGKGYRLEVTTESP